MKYNKIEGIEDCYLMCLKDMLRKRSGIHAYTLLRSFKRIYPKNWIYYYLGLYYLEYGKVYCLMNGIYIEGRVSIKRARRCFLKIKKSFQNNSHVLAAIGETYFKEKNYEKALLFYTRAHQSDHANCRYVWCIIESSYQLRRFNEILDVFEKEQGLLMMDSSLWFWANIVAVYSAIQENDFKIANEYLFRISADIPSNIENNDVAIISLIELLCIVGDYSTARELFITYEQDIPYIVTECREQLSSKEHQPHFSKGMIEKLVMKFTPVNLVRHLDF